jgi:hypothetical protein
VKVVQHQAAVVEVEAAGSTCLHRMQIDS